MKGNKIIATLVVLAMVLSTLVVLNQLNINLVNEASAAPGVNAWGYPTNTTTKGLTYGTSEVFININTTGLQIRNYYLYYPVYRNPYNLTWKPYKVGSVQKSIHVSTIGAGPVALEGIVLNRSGIWVLNTTENTAVIKGNSAPNWASTANKWFWVNTSNIITMTIEPSSKEVLYGNNETITVTAADSTYVWFDVRRANNAEPDVKLAYNTSGVLKFSSNWKQTLKWAGNYSIIAYQDLDDDMPSYQTLGFGYNRTFGSSPAIAADYYSYAVCGPWDPPEKNTTYQTLLVKSGVPKTSIPPVNETMYWNRAGRVNITVKDYNTQNISKLRAFVYNSDDENVTANVTVDTSKAYRGWITLYSANWGKDGNNYIWGTNGTWYAYVWYDVDGDNATQGPEWADEWNTTVEFTVGQAPAMQLVWVDDDGASTPSQSDTDQIIQTVPARTLVPLKIKFQIINKDGDYFGAGGTYVQAKGNITLSGDAEFLEAPITLDKYPMNVTFTGGTTWNVNITPKMNLNGGTITISTYWKGNGSVSSTLNVGGDLSGTNGSIVTISPAEFTYGENVTITVNVKDLSGVAASNAVVSLYWVNDSQANVYKMGKLYGLLVSKSRGSGGDYTFTLNTTQLSKNQTIAGNPWAGGHYKGTRNISAYVDLNNVGYGYALAKMKPRSDLKVTISKGTIMAGERTKFWVNVSKVGSDGNKTGYPKTNLNDLQVALYNETGDKVTLDATFGSIRLTDLQDLNNSINKYILKSGTYTIYAYNNTDDSRGYNATLIVKAVDVTSDPIEFIWNVDKNSTATFTVTYNGNPVNGTLVLYNITDVGAYNKTWVNESGTGNDSISLTVTNGVAIISNVTANYLPADKSKMNVTFTFKPKTSGSDYACASGKVPVTIAHVTATPTTLPYNEPATLQILISGRGTTPLEGVWVSVIIPGLTGEMNTTTDADGMAIFAFTPPTTGYIKINVENRTSSTKVRVTSWKLYIDAALQVNEESDFTITVRNGTSAAAGVANVAVKFYGNTQTTGADGKATFTAPPVTGDRNYVILATAGGYAEATATIQVINIPKLIVAVSGEVKAGQTFTLTIADDTGGPVIGATVTFEGTTYTTGAGGVITLTAPSAAGNYSVTATFPGFTSVSGTVKVVKGGGIPGFELLTLIAAIGVAFLLLRRRRN
jgi:hypothetical protein